MPNSTSRPESEIARRQRDRQAALDRRRRQRWIGAGIVLAPVLAAWLYAVLIAAPRYDAESRFFVQSSSGQQGGPPTLLAPGNAAGMLGGFVDGWAVSDFLKSRDCMHQLDQKIGLRRYFSHGGLDPVNRLSEDASDDELYRAYQSAVQVSFNVLEQIDVLRVSGFSPADATLISKALIGLAEDFVSRMNEKGVSDSLRVSKESLRLAQQQAHDAREALTVWRTTNGNVDPEASVTMLMNLASQLEGELNTAQINLDKIRALENRQHPMLRPAELQVAALKARLASVHHRLSGKGDTEATQLKSYEELRNAQAFADANLSSAQQSYQQATVNTLRLQRYLSIIAQPVPGDRPSSPRTRVLLLEALAAGFVLLFLIRVIAALLKEFRHG
jgi:capsular polysaccharide transport system permease protein